MVSVKLFTNNVYTNQTIENAINLHSQRMRHFLEDKVVSWQNTSMLGKMQLLDQHIFQRLPVKSDSRNTQLNFI